MQIRVETEKRWLNEYEYVYTFEGLEGDADIVKTILALKNLEMNDVFAIEFQVTQKKTMIIKTRSGSRKKSSGRIIACKSFYDMISSSLYICSNRKLENIEIEEIKKAVEEKIRKPVNLVMIKPAQS